MPNPEHIGVTGACTMTSQWVVAHNAYPEKGGLEKGLLVSKFFQRVYKHSDRLPPNT
jgi:hypothetical protein